MYVRMAAHRPRPEKADLFLDSMRRFKAAQTGLPGLVNVFALADETVRSLVGQLLEQEAKAEKIGAESLPEEA